MRIHIKSIVCKMQGHTHVRQESLSACHRRCLCCMSRSFVNCDLVRWCQTVTHCLAFKGREKKNQQASLSAPPSCPPSLLAGLSPSLLLSLELVDDLTGGNIRKQIARHHRRPVRDGANAEIPSVPTQSSRRYYQPHPDCAERAARMGEEEREQA